MSRRCNGSTAQAIAALVAHDLLGLITCRMGAGAPRFRAPRQDRACQTGFQGSEIEPVQPYGVGTQRATFLVDFEK
jgi:hypothetical protein